MAFAGKICLIGQDAGSCHVLAFSSHFLLIFINCDSFQYCHAKMPRIENTGAKGKVGSEVGISKWEISVLPV